MNDVEIFTRPGCGWAERNYAALIEKRVPFRLVMSCDPDGAKTQEFLSVSPYARTPAMRFGGDTAWESAVINEFIDDRFPHPQLRPQDALGRAHARLMVYHCDNFLIAGVKALAQDHPDHAIALRQLALLEDWWISRETKGPLWMGAQISLVDMALHTYFQTHTAAERADGAAVPGLPPALTHWRDAIAAHPSIQAAGLLASSLTL